MCWFMMKTVMKIKARRTKICLKRHIWYFSSKLPISGGFVKTDIDFIHLWAVSMASK